VGDRISCECCSPNTVFHYHFRRHASRRRARLDTIDGSSRKIKVGNQIIHFKHAGPRALLGAGTSAGVALQAIRAFGPDHLTADVIRQLRQSLPADAKNGLKQLAHYAPHWMASAIDAVTA
jgi:hypothetical protein